MIYKESLVVLSPFGKVESFNKITGKKISEVKIHGERNFSGGLPWGNPAIDEKKALFMLLLVILGLHCMVLTDQVIIKILQVL